MSMKLNTFRRGVLGLSLGLGMSVTAVGCGGGDGNDSKTSTTGGSLTILFPKVYSAVIVGSTTRPFQVPVTVPSIHGVKWSLGNSKLAEITAYEDDPAIPSSDALLTMTAPGNTTINAKTTEGLTGSVPLNVTAVTDADWNSGFMRYSQGTVLRGDVATKELACTNCHGMGTEDVEHTPAQTGGYSDEELITIFTMGKKPAGAPQRVIKDAEAWGKVHMWNVPDTKGMIAYLRSLPPIPQGEADFGGGGVFRPAGQRGGRGGDGGGGGRNGDGGGGRNNNNGADAGGQTD